MAAVQRKRRTGAQRHIRRCRRCRPAALTRSLQSLLLQSKHSTPPTPHDILRSMRGHARHRWTAAGVTLLPFLGVWMGHTADARRLHGTPGMRGAVTGSVHGYMLPAGIVLSLLAAAGGLRCAQAWWALGLRLRIARDAVARALRGAPLPVPPAQASRDPQAFTSLMLWLAPVQL